MSQTNPPISILIAEDDDDHYFLTEKILRGSLRGLTLRRAVDGEELMDCLLGRETVAVKSRGLLSLKPNLVILDINMPRKDGWESLDEIKRHPHLRQIPIVVLTTSDVEEDKFRSYDLGANSYIRKPISYSEWVETFRIFNRYWFQTVALPKERVESLNA